MEEEQSEASALPIDEIEGAQGLDLDLKDKEFENDLLTDIVEGKIAQLSLRTEQGNPESAGRRQFDLTAKAEDDEEEDEYEDDFLVDDEPEPEEITASATPIGVYSQSSQEVLSTFDFSKKDSKVDENENSLSIPSTPPELSEAEDAGITNVNQMKRDPLYAASALVTGEHRSIIDAILVIKDDDADLATKEALIGNLLGEIDGDRDATEAHSNDPEPGWLTDDFFSKFASEIQKLRKEFAEQEGSDVNAPKMQELELEGTVQSEDEGLIAKDADAGEEDAVTATVTEISNSGSEPNLNLNSGVCGLEGEITPASTSSLIQEETTDIIASEDNSKLDKGKEDEIVNLGDASPRPKKSSVVHCLAGVQEFPGQTLHLNMPPNNLGYYSPENKRMLSMGQQTDSESEESPRGGGVKLGHKNDNVLNEENDDVDSVMEPPPDEDVLPTNRPTSANAFKFAESEDELNLYHDESELESEDVDHYINILATNEEAEADAVEEEVSEQKEVTVVISTETVKLEPQPEENLPEVIYKTNSSLTIFEESVFHEDVPKNVDETWTPEEIAENIPVVAATLTTEIAAEAPQNSSNLRAALTSEIIVEQTSVEKPSASCAANFPTNNNTAKYEETSAKPEENPESVVVLKTTAITEAKDKYHGASILDCIAGLSGPDPEPEPEVLEKVAAPSPKLSVVINKYKCSAAIDRLATPKKAFSQLSPSASTVAKPGSSAKVKGRMPPVKSGPLRAPSKISPTTTTDGITSATFVVGPEAGRTQAENSEPSGSGTPADVQVKSRIRKCSTGPGPAAKPKTGSKPIRPITQPSSGYGQLKEKERSRSRPSTGTTSTTAGSGSIPGPPRPSTRGKKPPPSARPVWK